jgi:hypothetical protein
MKRIFKENIFILIFWAALYLNLKINVFGYVGNFIKSWPKDITQLYIYPIIILLLLYPAYKYFRRAAAKKTTEKYIIYSLNLFLAVLINIIAAAK